MDTAMGSAAHWARTSQSSAVCPARSPSMSVSSRSGSRLRAIVSNAPLPSPCSANARGVSRNNTPLYARLSLPLGEKTHQRRGQVGRRRHCRRRRRQRRRRRRRAEGVNVNTLAASRAALGRAGRGGGLGGGGGGGSRRRGDVSHGLEPVERLVCGKRCIFFRPGTANATYLRPSSDSQRNSYPDKGHHASVRTHNGARMTQKGIRTRDHAPC